MSLRKKTNLFMITFISIVLAITIAIFVFGFRQFAVNSAEDKANVIAKIVRDGLTAHMENGIMDKRDIFLSKIKRVNGVKSLKILRSKFVDKQFGKKRESFQKIDEIEREVLESGKEKSVVKESKDGVDLRVVVPYIASSYETPNCLKCHDAKEGDVLGAISMDFDITSIRENSILIIGKILFAVFVISLIGLYIVNLFVNQYVEFFENIKFVIKSAYEGDYSKRVKAFRDKELNEVGKWLNSLLDKIERNLLAISDNVKKFINIKAKSKDPLLGVEELVNILSSIYKFKNIAEKDKSKEQVYSRIVELLNKKYGIYNFIIYEIDKKIDKSRHIVYKGVDKDICQAADDDINKCRAFRIDEDVTSGENMQVCGAVKERVFYVCIPLQIDKNNFLVISFIPSSKEEFERVKEIKNSFKNYLFAIKDTIKTRILLKELEDMSLKDRLTGAYNRRYLDIFVKESIPKALRTNIPYSILMLDIDHFKEVNDKYGHDIGDKVIKTLAKTVFEHIRESDDFVRYGGEEFLVLLYNCDKENAKNIAQKIKDSFQAKKIDTGAEIIHKSVSIGISEFPKDSTQFWQTIKFADIALYKAKESGRNKIVVYDPEKFGKLENY